ncbi:MAG: O-methyltransferase [Myxococcota bacterium]|nr:O-methyltransferase [Myxococcota bacterium]
MVAMTPARWQKTEEYINVVLGSVWPELDAVRERAHREGMPDIAVSQSVGQALKLLARASQASLAVEVGTLGGYSAAWIARGLTRPNGRLITIERIAAYAAFARRELATLGLGVRCDVLEGDALDVLGDLTKELDPESVDLLFLDADKAEYLAYWRTMEAWIKPGGMVVVDNALGTGSWWIDEEEHPERQGVHALTEALAHDPRYDTALFPLREGLLVARKREKEV